MKKLNGIRNKMRNKAWKKKLKSQSGESLAETLVALLIAALALVMLAGALTTATNVIERSRNKLDNYYSANETDSGVVAQKSGTPVDGGVTLTDTTNAIQEQSFPITYFKNDVFGDAPVLAYQYTPDGG